MAVIMYIIPLRFETRRRFLCSEHSSLYKGLFSLPIKIPDSLPARAVLESENIFVMTEHRATTQRIRPLRIAILNLMPLKIVTETQILRCLSNTPIQIEVDLIQTKTYHSKNTPEDHLLTFYKTFDDIRDQRYDGFIITGAPVELMPFEEVEYWDELVEITSAGVRRPAFITTTAFRSTSFHTR